MINNHILHSVLGIVSSSEKIYQQLALSNTNTPDSLSFFDDPRYADEMNANSNITGVFVEDKNKSIIQTNKEILVVDDPRWNYFTLYNFILSKE